MWKPYRKGTVLAGYGNFYKKHLCIIASDAKTDIDGIEKVIVIACATYDGRLQNDDTCFIEQDEHPFIKHRSFVFYRRAELVATSRLKQDYKDKQLKVLEDLSEAVMQRIEDGMRITPQTSEEVNDFFWNAQ